MGLSQLEKNPMTANPEIPNQFSDVFGMGAPVQVYKAKSVLAEIIILLFLFGGAAGSPRTSR